MTRNMCLMIVAILLLAVAGCKDDSVPTVTGGSDVTFPHKVGSLWTYEYMETHIVDVDTTIVVTGTVDVVIIRDTILPNGDSATIWVFRYGAPAVPDTFLVVMAGDTVKLEWDTQSLMGTPTPIILPFDTSLTWVGGVGYTDTTTVSGPFSVSVAGGSFSDTYWLVRRWASDDVVEQIDIWLVPNVGIVWYRFHLVQPMLQPSEKYLRWELLSYNLP